MNVPAVLVAVGFGLLMGWAMGGPTFPRKPVTVSLVLGVAAGAATVATSFGSDPALAGWSLVLGCGAALATVYLRARMRVGALSR